MEVVQLHKTQEQKSKHDIPISNGTKFLRFDLHKCGAKELHVTYSIEMPVQEHLKKMGVPAFIIENLADPEQKHQEIVFEQYIERKWYHKLLGVSLEKLVLKFIKESKKRVENKEHEHEAFNIVKELIEKSSV